MSCRVVRRGGGSVSVALQYYLVPAADLVSLLGTAHGDDLAKPDNNAMCLVSATAAAAAAAAVVP